MSWPTHTDYQDSIQNPHITFEDEGLKTGEVGCDMLGLPKVTSGNFACVYSITTGDERWAIRCFVRQVLGQQGRYARLSQHLLGLDIPCMVAFEYILRGIKVRNEMYPIVKMQWVDGLPLNQFLEENCKDREIMQKLVDRWPPMLESLREHQLAHGDLQHGNVMVTPDAEFRLVDYDGMFTPAFRGKSPELGHANFQHPRRTPEFYNEQLDNFAALVIYTSLIAIKDQPEIFDKFYTGDNVLLQALDYRNPRESEALKTLKQHPTETVKQLALLIERCCLTEISKVPEFSEVVATCKDGDPSTLLEEVAAPAQTSEAPAGGGWWSQGDDENIPLGSMASPGMIVEDDDALTPSAPPATPSPSPSPSAPGYLAASQASATPKPSKPATRPASSTTPRPASSTRATSSRIRQQKEASQNTPTPVTPPPAADDSTKMYALMGLGAVCIIVILYFLGKNI